MKISALSFAVLATLAAGCATTEPPPLLDYTALPNCYAANYSQQQALFTIQNPRPNVVNQRCALTVSRANAGDRLLPGRYSITLAGGGGGGAGGSFQTIQMIPGTLGSGGGGGGGAGAAEMRSTVELREGIYVLTIGAGGPGGNPCMPTVDIGGGPGWLGSPSNIVRADSGAFVMGTPGAEKYVRPSRSRNEKNAGVMDGHGGTTVGGASGGDATIAPTPTKAGVAAEAGDSKGTKRGGESGPVPRDDRLLGAGGGGGATTAAAGGGGGGETVGNKSVDPQRGKLGSGGGGGAGTGNTCEGGAPGGHGFVAFSRI
ncbi:MAG: hypothetical protein H7232_09365 [Aeromicrobium sp.]|nr:hypothetical protein [Burkholderiales bacterium]